MSWAIWLAVPAGVTLLAALWSWLRSRPRPEPTTNQAMRAHDDYLEALVQAPRAKDRGPYAPNAEPTADRSCGPSGGPAADEGTG